MDAGRFDRLARRLGSPASRRGLLILVAGAGLAAAPHPLTVAAKGGGGRKKQKDKKDKEKRCREHERACIGVWNLYCDDKYIDFEEYIACIALYADCCNYLGRCQDEAGLSCIDSVPY